MLVHSYVHSDSLSMVEEKEHEVRACQETEATPVTLTERISVKTWIGEEKVLLNPLRVRVAGPESDKNRFTGEKHTDLVNTNFICHGAFLSK